MFSKSAAAKVAATLSDAELKLTIHVICSAFNEAHFPGIHTLDHVRQMVDVLTHENNRRFGFTAEQAIPQQP